MVCKIKTLAAEAFFLIRVEEQVRAYVMKNGPISTNRLRKVLHIRKASLLSALNHLREVGKLDTVEGPRKARLWI